MRWAASSGRRGIANAERIAQQALPGQSHCFFGNVQWWEPGGGGWGVTGETRGSRPGVPLNKSIGDGTSGSVGRAGGPGVRVGGFAGGVLAAGCSQGVRGMGSFVGEWGGSRGAVCGGRVG